MPTLKQIVALYRLWARSETTQARMTFREFRATAELNSCADCLMVQWCGMWIGIERDGYAHS